MEGEYPGPTPDPLVVVSSHLYLTTILVWCATDSDIDRMTSILPVILRYGRQVRWVTVPSSRRRLPLVPTRSLPNVWGWGPEYRVLINLCTLTRHKSLLPLLKVRGSIDAGVFPMFGTEVY